MPSGARPSTLELIEGFYRKAPHLTLYTPLCKIRHVLQECSYLVSTDGKRLSAVVAYDRDAIELTWGLPGHAEILRNLIVQVKNRLKTLAFLPVMETGRRSWSEMLSLQVLGRHFRAVYMEAVPGPAQLPSGLRIIPVDPSSDLQGVVDLMNAAYPSLPRFVDRARLEEMTRAESYYADGWFFLQDDGIGRPIGVAVGGYCPQTDEGFIDWVQVLPRHRHQGLGGLLVQELVRRLAAAGRITVSGSLDAPFAVGELYANCGFAQFRQWTLLGQSSPAAQTTQGSA